MSSKLKQAAAKIQAGKHLRILTIDIETRPAVVHAWGLFNQSFGLAQVQDRGGPFAFAAKWLGSKTEFYSDWTHGHDEMILQAHRLLTEADVVVGFNSDNFDLKHLNWEFAKAGLARPRPYKSVDMLKVVRANFRPLSKKLDNVAQELELGAKLQHEGHDLWVKVLAGDAAAQRKMERYNRRDVVLTEQLFLANLGWLPGSVNLALIAGDDGQACPSCAGTDLRPDGSVFTALTEYAAYQCRNCGQWIRANVVKTRTTRRVIK